MTLNEQITFMQDRMKTDRSEINKALLGSLLTLQNQIYTNDGSAIVVQMNAKTYAEFNSFLRFNDWKQKQDLLK